MIPRVHSTCPDTVGQGRDRPLRPSVPVRHGARSLVGGLLLLVGVALTSDAPVVAAPALPDLKVAQTVSVVGSTVTFTLTPTVVIPPGISSTIALAETLPAGLPNSLGSGAGWNCLGMTTGGLFPANAPTLYCYYSLPSAVTAGTVLAPVTVSVTLPPATSATSLTACATVWRSEAAGSYGTLADLLAATDANPADNRTCLGPPSKQTGTLCVKKWNDLDADGVRDAGEPALGGWTFRLSATTALWTASVATRGSGAPGCKKVPAGPYSVSEVIAPGWRQTSPAAGAATLVSVPVGGTVTATFGNTRERCCVSAAFLGGIADDFKPAGIEQVEWVPGASASMSNVLTFDWAAPNRNFTHRIELPADHCIDSARYEIRLKAVGPTSTNDTILLQVPGIGASGGWTGTTWSRNLQNLSAAASPAYPWTAGKPARTYAWDLGSLSATNAGGANMLAALQTVRVLDTWVANDTSVDFIRLTVTFCECADTP